MLKSIAALLVSRRSPPVSATTLSLKRLHRSRVPSSTHQEPCFLVSPVEASVRRSIEKTRSVVTDGTGQFRIEQLRGGTYTVVLHAARILHRSSRRRRAHRIVRGHHQRRAEGSARSKKPSPSPVTSPIVDIQSAQRQRVIDQELLECDSDRPHAAGCRVHDPRRQPEQRRCRRHEHHQHHRRIVVDPWRTR